MNNYELVEYRPGRWAKIDAMTGSFLGPAGADEVRSWRHQPVTPLDPPELPMEVEWKPAADSRPNPPALNARPSAPVLRAHTSPPQPPSPSGLMDESAPQKPDGEGQTPQPTPEKKKGDPQKPAPKPNKAGPRYPLARHSRISSSFRAHQMRRPPSTAPGIDLPCPHGTDVRAWAVGKVLRSRWSAGGGRSLWIQHAGGIKTYYAHLRAAFVLEGESVKAGQKIGESGSTGCSTGPHLHFSVVKGGKYVDPERFLKA